MTPAARRTTNALFDRYLAIDWSACNKPKTGADSIWIGEAHRADDLICCEPSRNPRTRSAAMEDICNVLVQARACGERVMIGFDFAFGYPLGAAGAIAREPDWRALWRKLAGLVKDSDSNDSNRFEVAGFINNVISGGCPRYYGHPNGRSFAGLSLKRPKENSHAQVRERRVAEARCRGAQPVWKLIGAGSVGSQTILGIARLEALRSDPRFAHEIAVWPFETEFERKLQKPVAIVEMYPSLFDVPEGAPRDRMQVETAARRFAELDAAGDLAAVLSAPDDLGEADRRAALAEEGWIAGVGRENVLRGRS